MKVRKLTPDVLKRIIAEEKKKIAGKKIEKDADEKANKKKENKKKESKEKSVEKKIDEVTKLALQEVKVLRLARKLRNRRNRLKSSISKNK